MSEDNKPFTEYATQPEHGPDSAKPGWIAAGIMAALLIAALLLWASALGNLLGLEPLRSGLAEANASLTNALAEIKQDKGKIASLQAQAADLEKEKETASQRAKGLKMKCARPWNPGMSPFPTCKASSPSISSTA